MCMRREVLIVDGYNMIGAWPELVKLKGQDDIEGARDQLLQRLSNYAGYHALACWVVFDAMFVPGLSKSYKKYRLNVVFTAEGETADSYIEAMIQRQVGVLTNVTVATSDLAEQRLVFQQGAIRQSALELLKNVQQTEKNIRRGEKNHDRLALNYQRRNPWTYHQLQTLKNLLDDLSQSEE